MIKAEELRIGNMVYVKPFGIEVPAGIKYGHEIDNADEFEPIPISEEWLLRFGFTRLNMGGYKYKNLEVDYITTEDHYETELKLTLGDWILKPLKYVHELQNYFFALYNEELTVKN